MSGTLLNRRSTKVLTIIVLSVVLIYFLFPIYWLLLASTKSNAAMTTSNGLWFADEIRLKENYETLIGWTPLHAQGMGWVVPTVVAAVVGFVVDVARGASDPVPVGGESQEAAQERVDASS